MQRCNGAAVQRMWGMKENGRRVGELGKKRNGQGMNLAGRLRKEERGEQNVHRPSWTILRDWGRLSITNRYRVSDTLGMKNALAAHVEQGGNPHPD